jgi:hypothetical protein
VNRVLRVVEQETGYDLIQGKGYFVR